MTIQVTDKTEKITLGSTYELRGNFKEIIDEEGNISYSCDMYRTTNKNITFEKLYSVNRKKELEKFLSDSDYVVRKLSECIIMGKDKEVLLDSYSNTFGMTNREVIEKSDLARVEIRNLNNE